MAVVKKEDGNEVIDAIPDLEEKCKKMGKPYRFQAQRGHFTYRFHLDKVKYAAWAVENFRVKEVHMAHETADSHHPYEHTHVVLEWACAFQSRSSSRFDWPFPPEGYEHPTVHPNIKAITTMKQLENAYRYLAKEDPACIYLFDKLTNAFSKRVWSCKTLDEALIEIERPNDVLGTIAMFKSKPMRKLPPKGIITNFRPWQECFLAEIEEEPDDRKIIWIYDKKGGAGKSRLALHIKYSGMGWIISGSTFQRDIAHLIRGRLEAEKTMRVIIVDLTRAFENKEVYNLLEMLKMGEMVSGKYDSCEIAWMPGHVAVFANFLPMYNGCSEDRWIIHEVSSSCPEGEGQP